MALPYDIHSNPTFIATQQAKDMVRDVATGRRTMCLICSDTGFRKSYETKHCLRQCRVPFHECAPSTESALVRVLWGIESGLILHKGRKPAVMVADDQDAIWQRPTIANQMKSVFGSDRRCVIFETPEALKNEDRRNSDSESERAKYKATIAPPTFGVLVRLICHANLNYTHPSVVAGLSEHFRALVSKGLDPHWIPNDAEHDGRDVFLHTHWLATEGKSLRSEGFPYEVARRAVKFYVENVHKLIDIPPRRLSQIAYTILNNPDPAECEKRLSHMLRPTDQRPRLILPEPWRPVLLWPSEPPRRPDPAHQPDPPPAASAPIPVQPEPNPDPPPAASAPRPVEPEPEPDPDPTPSIPELTPSIPDPDPDPTPTLRPIPGAPPGAPIPPFPGMTASLPSIPERGQSPFDAIDEVYRLPIETTCQMVAEVLRHYPLDQWDRDDFDRLVEGLEGRAEWSQCAAIAEPFFLFDTTDSHKLCCTEAEGVLEYRDGRLEICSWESIEERIAPAVAEAKQRHAQQRRDQEVHDILIKRLPPQRKLKVMKASIDRLAELNFSPKTEDGQKAVAYVRAMTGDDPRFADCKTFNDYLHKAVEITEARTQGTDDV